MDGTKAYVLGATIKLLTGSPDILNFIVGKMNLPNTVNPSPNIGCNKPKIQNQGPNIVHGFLVQVLIRVRINKKTHKKVNTINPINNPRQI